MSLKEIPIVRGSGRVSEVLKDLLQVKSPCSRSQERPAKHKVSGGLCRVSYNAKEFQLLRSWCSCGATTGAHLALRSNVASKDWVSHLLTQRSWNGCLLNHRIGGCWRSFVFSSIAQTLLLGQVYCS